MTYVFRKSDIVENDTGMSHSQATVWYGLKFRLGRSELAQEDTANEEILFRFRLSYHVEGLEEEDISLTRDEELQIDNQLKLLNKPAVKTIKTSYGDLYDCVDFYKQPAFDHPLLKNHSFHPRMKPPVHPSVSKRTRGDKRSKDEKIPFVRVDCPFGTVPIRRVTKEELVRTKLHEKRYALTHDVLAPQEPGVHYAVVGSKFDPAKRYRGGSGFIKVYNVTIKDHAQYSLARMRVQGGTDFIEAGTMTNPGIYNTLDTHLFIRTKTSALDCFNLRCPGFIQVVKDFPIDAWMHPVSEKEVKSINAKFSIVMEGDGNWWYYFNYRPRTVMGFWPWQYMKGGLQTLATGLDWGGEVSGPVDIPPAPMGGGSCPVQDVLLDGYCLMLKVINEARQEIDLIETETTCDIPVYKVYDRGIVDPYGHLLFFGGDGTTLC